MNEVPHSVEAEQVVLGSILHNPTLISIVTGRGGTDLFYDPVHTYLFDVMVQRDRDGLVINAVALRDLADHNRGFAELGGGKYLVKMVGVCVSEMQLKHYVDILAEYAGKRTIAYAIASATDALMRGEDTAASIAGQLEAAILMNDLGSAKAPVSMMKAVTKSLEASFAAYAGEDDGGIQSGLPALDDIVSGFYAGELILLGGRPSMGKTAVALSMALNVARAGHGVAIVSLEMTPEAMAARAISEATGIAGNPVAYSSMRRGDFSEDQARKMMDVSKSVAELPIMFLPSDYSDLTAMTSGLKQIKRTMGDKLRLIIVDYAQILRVKGGSRYEQITEISIALKSLAMKLGVPLLALSQLSRSIEQREDKRPMMSDLRESGQLEQDADTILFCYRDEYYADREPIPSDPEKVEALWQRQTDARGKVEIIVAKQRQGTIGTARMNIDIATNRIYG